MDLYRLIHYFFYIQEPPGDSNFEGKEKKGWRWIWAHARNNKMLFFDNLEVPFQDVYTNQSI